MKRKKAIFTKIKNGGPFFEIWYSYYAKFFDEKDIYVINFGSTDGSLEDRGCNKINLSPDFYQVGGRSSYFAQKIIDSYKTLLLNFYEYVVNVDFDELLYHPLGIGQFIDTLEEDYVTCQGYEIVQHKSEPVIDFSLPILNQRSFWYPYSHFDKSLITKIDLTWSIGQHGASIAGRSLPPNYAADLLLIHLHKVDRDYAYDLNYSNVAKLRDDHKKLGIKDPRSAEGIDGGYHNFILHEEFDNWWSQAEKQLVEIPKFFKETLLF
jgi:hypothetical protein